MDHLSTLTIDDVLGPSGKRFFGAGFKRVCYDWREEDLDLHHALFRIELGYPSDWSRKATDSDLKPHLSTIDAIVIAAGLCERMLALRGLDLQQVWITKLSIKAGSQPAESLDAVVAQLRESPAPEVTSLRFSGKIGQMSVQIELGRFNSASSPSIATAYEPGKSYFGSGFKDRVQKIERLSLEGPDHATAQLELVDAEPVQSVDGIDNADERPSLVDLFVTHLQIAQVLLYRLDTLTRAESNTLWMRNTSFVAAPPAERVGGAHHLETRLTDTQLLPSDDGFWRTAMIVGTSPGVTLRCGVAHLLPRRGV